MQPTRLSGLPVVGLSALLAAVLAGCGGAGTGASSSPSSAPNASTPRSTGASAGATAVTIGSANFPENEILADIYADALAGHGVKVTKKLDIGSREIYYKLLQSGQVTVFPEYNGALLSYLRPSTTASSTSAVDSALAGALPKQLEVLNPSPAQDKDSLTVTAAFAAAHHLSSIADLKAIEGQITVGAPPEFASRQEGLVGLKALYGVVPAHFKALDESGPLTIAALKGGTIQVGDIFTTDPSITTDHFVALADPRNLFPAQNVIPVVNRSVASATVTSVLDAVSAALTTQDLVALNTAVEVDHADAATVAAAFVKQAKL